MDKRFQFFISSTFTDLKDERQAVLKAVLEMNHMPAGMELFPAADDSAWQLIKDVIDSSDYYLLVVGGRYGSVDDEGLGYTEKEYDYAIQTRKPVCAFLHQDPGKLPREHTETDDAAWTKLVAFRKKVEKSHHCDYWASAEGLKSKVVLALSSVLKRHPAVGWVRADQVPSGSTLADVVALHNEVSALKAQLAETAIAPPPGTEQLEQGDSELLIPFTCPDWEPGADRDDDEDENVSIAPTWNQIFAAVAPSMLHERSDHDLRIALRAYFDERARRQLAEEGHSDPGAISFRESDIETCVVQFRALGLIRENVRPRSVKDTKTYWRLTSHGDHLMTQLRAIRRDPGSLGKRIAGLADGELQRRTHALKGQGE